MFDATRTGDDLTITLPDREERVTVYSLSAGDEIRNIIHGPVMARRSVTVRDAPDIAFKLVVEGETYRALVQVPSTASDMPAPTLIVTWPGRIGQPGLQTFESDRVLFYDTVYRKDPRGVGFPLVPSLTLLLDNADGRFTPGNPHSPLRGYVRSGCTIRLSESGVTVFEGRCDSIAIRDVDSDAGSRGAEFRAKGRLPAREQVQVSSQTNPTVASTLGLVLDAAGFPTERRIYHGTGPLLASYAEPGASATNALRTLVLALQHPDRLGNLNGWIGQSKAGYVRLDEAGWYTDGPEIPAPLRIEDEGDPADQVINVATATAFRVDPRGRVRATRKIEIGHTHTTDPEYGGSQAGVPVAVLPDGTIFRLGTPVAEGQPPPANSIPLHRGGYGASRLTSEGLPTLPAPSVATPTQRYRFWIDRTVDEAAAVRSVFARFYYIWSRPGRRQTYTVTSTSVSTTTRPRCPDGECPDSDGNCD